MKPELFQRELGRLRDLSREFARRHPAVAPLLLNESADPDVERVLEGTAFLAAMVGEKIDDQLPEVIHTLTQVLFPHYLKPVPSMTVMRLEPKPGLMEPLTVARGTRFASLAVNGRPCVFSSSRELRLLPLTLTDCGWRDGNVLRLRFAAQGVPMSAWGVESLRLFFPGEYAPACERYRMLLSHAPQVVLREHGTDRLLTLPGAAVRAAGFADEDAVLPYPRRSFAGFRILQEYFAFPEKFLSLDIVNLGPFFAGASGKGFDMDFYVDAKTFPDPIPFRKEHVALHAVPAVNLLEHDAEPVRIDFTQPEYRLSPADNAGGTYEIHSVLNVSGLARNGSAEQTYRPFELFGGDDDASPAYAQSLRTNALDERVDWYLSFARPGGRSFEETFRPETLSVRLLCTNGTLPESLKPGDVRDATDNSPVLAAFENLTVPTPYCRPPLDGRVLWRLVSHMYVNYFAINDLESLRTLLRLYVRSGMRDQGGARARLRRIEAVAGLRSNAENRLVGGIMMRGNAVCLTVDPAGFPCKGDMLLFGTVLDRFFASYSAINCYTRFSLENRDNKEMLAWPTRLGTRSLL